MKDDARLSALEAQVADLLKLPEYVRMIERRLAADMQTKMYAAQVADRPPPPAPRDWCRVSLHTGRDLENFAPGRRCRDGVPDAIIGELTLSVFRGGHVDAFPATVDELKRSDAHFASLLATGGLKVRPCTPAEIAECERLAAVSRIYDKLNPTTESTSR